jgi:ribosomal-protein-alanine N-acetyltransferase
MVAEHAELRETNLAAQVFFRSSGFRATSVLHEFYDDSPEDAYLMQFYCPQEAAPLLLPFNRVDRLAG